MTKPLFTWAPQVVSAALGLNGATLTIYLAGTTTPVNVYSDKTLTTSLGNVLTADSLGVFANFFGASDISYKFVLAHADIPTKTYDNAAIGDGATISSTVGELQDIAALRAQTWTAEARPDSVLLRQNWYANDGGGIFVLDASDTTSSDNSGTIIVDGLSNRWKRQELTDYADPRWFGAVGDAATNDDAEFALLEAWGLGAAVNLLGRTYLVTAIPMNARYYGGTFKVGSTLTTMPKTFPEHLFDTGAPPAVIWEGTDGHPWAGPVGIHPTSGIYYGATVVTNEHGSGDNSGAALVFERGYDGLQFEVFFTIPTNTSYEPRHPVGGFIGTTFFVFFVEMDTSGVIQATKCALIDCSTTTPSLTAVNTLTPTTNIDPHDVYITGTTAIVVGSAGDDIRYMKTTNSASTWAASALVMAGGSADLREPTISRVNSDTNDLMVIARNDLGGNAKASVSGDLGVTWGAQTDTGIPLGTNPPHMRYWGGRTWLIAPSRLSTEIFGLSDKLLAFEFDGNAAHAASGAISSYTWTILADCKSVLLGYLASAQLRNGMFVSYFEDGETLLGSDVPTVCRVSRIGGYPAPVASPAIISRRRTMAPFTQNGNFRHWTRSTSVTGTASGGYAIVADRKGFIGTGDTFDVTQVELTDNVRRLVGGASRFGCNYTSGGSGTSRILFRNFFQGTTARDVMTSQADRVVTHTIIAYGSAFVGTPQAVVEFNYGGGGSTTDTITANYSQTTLGAGITKFTATMRTPKIDGVTWGTNPSSRFYMYSSATGAVNMTAVLDYWDWGDTSMAYEPGDYFAERGELDAWARRYVFGSSDLVCLVEATSTTAFTGEFTLGRAFVSDPTISLFTGTAATDFQIDATTNVATLTYDRQSPTRFRMNGTVAAGLTASDVYELTCNGTDKTFIAAVGH